MPSRWLHDRSMEDLSDKAFRVFANSLMLSNEQGTDGDLLTRDLRLLHPEGVDVATASELVAAGKWESTVTGYVVRDWSVTQSLAADVERKRELGRERQRKRRNAENTGDSEGVTRDVTQDVTRERSLGQDRTGSSGSELKLVPTGKSQTEMAADWDSFEVADDEAAEVHAAFAQANSPSLSSCPECQRRTAFGSGPCPIHIGVTA